LKQVMVQTFFKSDKTKYFVVTLSKARQDVRSTESEMEGHIKVLLEGAEVMNAEEDKRLGLIEANQYIVDKSPWMRRTGWLREFAGKDMNVIVGKSKKPTKEEPGLQVVWRSVMRLINDCVDGVKDCDERNWRLIGFWLNSPELEEVDGKPFSVDHDQSTVRRYAKYWGRFICYCLWMLNEEEGSGIQFLGDQWDDLEELQRLAEEDEDEYGIDRQVLWVSMQLIMYSEYAARKSGLVHFLGVLGYDERKKRWREPSTFTPILAGVQFWMRVLTWSIHCKLRVKKSSHWPIRLRLPYISALFALK
jgi:hypothetical protein